ncbi:terminase small subunit [Sansalvadorimonas verongulae]|uniref:terminase small subunit n=1 Tax=Sansalvadorimonas verongulae TaxID=2172824 RepID=UPI0012BB62BE|nr:terminase small subunit [Sansalvadorimonas verongulae]MTI13249.1 terminase small subunit [Sansalvadorimonas verongulae]
MAKGLNARQRRFVKEFMANGGNATQAAISSGYSSRSAYSQADRLMRNDEVLSELEEHRQELEKGLDMTIEKRLRYLKSVADKGLEPIVVGDTVRPPNLSAVVSAVAEMNRMLGTGRDEQEATPMTVVFNVRDPVVVPEGG